MNEKQQNIQIANDEIINLFVPLEIKKRGGSAIIILPKNLKKEEMTKCFDEKMIKAFAKAYKWKNTLEENEIGSLAQIAVKENITGAYVSKVFNLNFIAPEIVEKILNGEQPRDLKLQDIIMGKVPDLWQEQKEMWGFD